MFHLCVASICVREHKSFTFAKSAKYHIVEQIVVSLGLEGCVFGRYALIRLVLRSTPRRLEVAVSRSLGSWAMVLRIL
jgi:hypothetical protein